MDGREPIVEAKDIQDALDTVKAVEMMGYALEGEKFPLRFGKAMFHCMDILRNIHDDLVSRLPKEVIEAEQAKAHAPKPPVINRSTVPMGVA
jgi:hypothetical protein